MTKLNAWCSWCLTSYPIHVTPWHSLIIVTLTWFHEKHICNTTFVVEILIIQDLCFPRILWIMCVVCIHSKEIHYFTILNIVYINCKIDCSLDLYLVSMIHDTWTTWILFNASTHTSPFMVTYVKIIKSLSF